MQVKDWAGAETMVITDEERKALMEAKVRG
jgi:hypothetical protein